MGTKKEEDSSYFWIKVSTVDIAVEHRGWFSYLLNLLPNLLRGVWDYGTWLMVVVVLVLGYLHYIMPENHKDWLALLPHPNYIMVAVCLITVIGLVIWHKGSVEQQNNFYRKSVGVGSHHFFHLIRDDFLKKQLRMLRIIDKIDKSRTDKQREDHQENLLYLIKEFSGTVCKKTEKILDTIFLNEEIGCSIRIATENDDYETFGRSERLAPSRSNNTRAVRHDEGIPSAFKKPEIVNGQKCLRGQGYALVLTNIEAKDIINDGVWVKSPNDSDETVRSLLVVPINSYEEEGDRCYPIMIGLLYLTSRYKEKNCPFEKKHADIAATVADFLGCLYSQLL